jgi:hypothetical protein
MMSDSRRGIPLLSKSRFMAGLQCHKRLYLECFNRDLADPISLQQQQILDAGTGVGELARNLFPNGTLIAEDYTDHEGAMQTTNAALGSSSSGSVYEGAFLHDGVRIRADLIVPHRSGEYDLIEVKSTSRVKPEHAYDVGIQLYVLLGSGLNVRKACLCHLNNQYLFQGGEYDLSSLFRIEDITYEASLLQGEIPSLLAAMRADLDAPFAPVIETGSQCTSPYTCPFYSHCHIGETEYPIEELPRASERLLDTLRSQGLLDIRDIPEGFQGLNPLQQRVRECVATGQPFIDEELPRRLRGLRYPIHFLDFETFNPALPLYVGTRPYQQIPFQWSLHTMTEDGTVRHAEFLHDGTDDPREPFAASLVDALGDTGPVVVYSGFESARLRELAVVFPSLACPLEALAGERMVDLLQLVRTHCYHPDFRGSFSIKSVLPAFVHHLGYDDLAISDGSLASMAYIEMIAPATSSDRKVKIRQDLLDYCRRDTLAEVELFKFFTSQGSADFRRLTS